MSYAAAGQHHAGKHYTEWSEPVNIGAPINSEFQETGAKLTRQGRSLYFASNRPCGADDAVLDFNIWVARRKHVHAEWEEPECLAINADARVEGERPWSDRKPELSDDGHWRLFSSDRPGSEPADLIPVGGDIWVSWRHDVRDDHGWSEPFRLPGLNTEFGERGPQYFEHDRGHQGHGGKHGLPQLYFSSTRSGFLDLYVVSLLHGNVWGEPEPVTEVNTELVEAGGVLSPDGREMYIFRGDPRPQVGIDLDLYVAKRPHPKAPWSDPVSLGEPLNSPGNDQEPTLSDDGTLLIFSSNREGSMLLPNGVPSLDLWIAKRRPGKSDHGHGHGGGKSPWGAPGGHHGPGGHHVPGHLGPPDRGHPGDRGHGHGGAKTHGPKGGAGPVGKHGGGHVPHPPRR